MKRILLSIIAATLLGCVSVSTYDPNEYALANKITTISEITQKYCATDRDKVALGVSAMYVNTEMLKNYTLYRPHNADVTGLVNHFTPMVEEFYDKIEQKKEYSNTYCIVKLQIINTTATSIQEVLGNKPK
jgi:hypothetical protein